MTPAALILTTTLMGLLVLAGGSWAVLYCLARLRAQPALLHAARGCWALALALAAAIALATPLALGWKLLIVASALAYAAIPPITLRWLQALHEEPEARP